MKFKGVVELQKQMEKIAKGASKEFADALHEEMKVEAQECKKLVPVATGALKDSIRVTEPHQQGRKIVCEIVAGNEHVGYALFVHEDLEAHHEHGEAKFIERPLQESAPYMGERIARRIDFNRVK